MKDMMIIMEIQSRITIYVPNTLMVKAAYGDYNKSIANVGYSTNNVIFCYFMITINNAVNIAIHELFIINNAHNNSDDVNHMVIMDIYLKTIVYADIKPIVLNATHLCVIGCKKDKSIQQNYIMEDILNYLWETMMYKVK